MDNSTDGVTLDTGFISDVLREYESMRRVCGPAFKMAEGISNRPGEFCSIDIYNRICDWIEANIGEASVRKAGMAIGRRVYANIVAHQKLKTPTPADMMLALKWAASVMIRDPKGRGWEVLKHDGTSVVMRRTQTFNCMLQDGLLYALVEQTGVEGADVDHYKCTRRGDGFCEYRVSWLEGGDDGVS